MSGLGRWFRFYDSALDDPKVQKLSADQFRLWVNLLCLASRNGGKLPKPQDAAFGLRMTPAEYGPQLRDLVHAGLFDRVDGEWEPHNWPLRQYKSDVSTERVKRFRKRRETVSETPSESEADTETEADKKEMPNGIVACATAEDATRAFWMFNDSAKRTGWPAVQKLDPDRKKAMLARLKDVGGVEGFAIALGKAEASEFLTTGWPNFNLDWMLKPKNFRKLMEGNYDNRHREDPNARSLSAGLSGIFEAGSR